MRFSTTLSTFLVATAAASPLALPLAIPELDAVPVPLTEAQLEKRGYSFVYFVKPVAVTFACELSSGQNGNVNNAMDLYTGNTSPSTWIPKTGSLSYCAVGNTNLLFGGKIIYMFTWGTNDIHKAAGSARCWRQGNQDYNYQDLAEGAGGDYRYCEARQDTTIRNGFITIVTHIAMWRTSNGFNSPPAGWQGITQDINQGRRGDYLYLIWQSKEVPNQ